MDLTLIIEYVYNYNKILKKLDNLISTDNNSKLVILKKL